MDEATESRILSQEQPAIELLARETHTAIEKVQAVFLAEYEKLAEHAHITTYLPLLTCNCVRGILGSPHSRGDVAR